MTYKHPPRIHLLGNSTHTACGQVIETDKRVLPYTNWARAANCCVCLRSVGVTSAYGKSKLKDMSPVRMPRAKQPSAVIEGLRGKVPDGTWDPTSHGVPKDW